MTPVKAIRVGVGLKKRSGGWVSNKLEVPCQMYKILEEHLPTHVDTQKIGTCRQINRKGGIYQW